MPYDGIFLSIFNLFRQQELVKRPVQAGEITQFLVGNQVHFFQSAIQHLVSPEVAVIKHEIPQKTRGNLGARHSAAFCNALGS